MNTYTPDTFQKYERKRPSKRLLDTSLGEHSERYNKGNCVKRGWKGVRGVSGIGVVNNAIHNPRN